jgi:undecaprenyl diphosphate synthase
MTALIEEILKKQVPEHIAIIMDGNGRWAKKNGKPRVFGHQHGVNSVREVIEASMQVGVKYLTLYAFSTENWKRPKQEVAMLMGLLTNYIKKELIKLEEKNIKLNTIGNIDLLPNNVQKLLTNALERTKSNTGLTLTLALSYSAREELVYVAKMIAQKVASKTLEVGNIDEKLLNSYLQTSPLPDVDLMIRTSGEKRISNFLLWQIAYAELYFTDTLWPDFNKESFYEAVIEYQKRERRFGKTSEQIKSTNEQ